MIRIPNGRLVFGSLLPLLLYYCFACDAKICAPYSAVVSEYQISK